MRTLLLSSLLLLAAVSAAGAEEVVREVSWNQSKKSGELPAGEVAQKNKGVPGAWWDARTAGWIAGIGGTVIGLLGGLIGILASLGRARAFVLTLAAGLVVLGAGLVLSGLTALVLGQPYAVYYPLLLGGVILTLVMGLNLPGLRRRYEQIELRRMAAMDVGRQ